ncbi:MAG: DUF255 domain-containing protein, partial [Bacteroidota bacterium]
MRIIYFLIIACLYTSNLVCQEIKWVTIEKALELQKQVPKKIIMDMYTKWCGPCKMLDRNTFKNPDVIEYINANYYAVKFNAEGNDEIVFKDKTFTNPGY